VKNFNILAFNLYGGACKNYTLIIIQVPIRWVVTPCIDRKLHPEDVGSMDLRYIGILPH
jgi:hypothetical protein